MANHVTNRLELEGPAEKIKAMVDACGILHERAQHLSDAGMEIWNRKDFSGGFCWRDPQTGETRVVSEGRVVPFQEFSLEEWELDYVEAYLEFPSFEKIIPMPESLKCTSGSMAEIGYTMLTGEVVNPYGYPERQQARFVAMTPAEREACLEEGRMYKYNMEHHGYACWYDWSVAHWGTKWDGYSFRSEGNRYYFDTAWRPPTPVIEAMSKAHPEVRITHSYFDEGWNFWGTDIWSAGLCTSVNTSGMYGNPTEDPAGRQLCIDLKGYDPCENTEEMENT